jgi:hypothetical protein
MCILNGSRKNAAKLLIIKKNLLQTGHEESDKCPCPLSCIVLPFFCRLLCSGENGILDIAAFFVKNASGSLLPPLKYC